MVGVIAGRTPTRHGVDKLGVLIAVFVAAGVLLPFVSFAANRIVLGESRKLWEALSPVEAALLIAITLEEEGQYVKIFAPSAFNADGSDYLDVFLRTCMMVQWKTKLVQFEYDPSDGEVRPIVEFPLEDATLTERQLMRSVSGLVGLLDHFAPTLQKALDEGIVEMPDETVEEEATIESLAEFLAGFPPDILAEALGRADARMRDREGGDDTDGDDGDLPGGPSGGSPGYPPGYHPENDPSFPSGPSDTPPGNPPANGPSPDNPDAPPDPPPADPGTPGGPPPLPPPF